MHDIVERSREHKRGKAWKLEITQDPETRHKPLNFITFIYVRIAHKHTTVIRDLNRPPFPSLGHCRVTQQG